MSRLILIPIGAAGAIALSIVGCGSIGGADGLFDSGSVGAGGTTSSTASAGGSPTATTSTTSATTTSATTTSATTTTSAATTTSSVTTGASTSSASGSSTSTGVVVSDMLACGDTTCPEGALNACCWSKFAMPPSGTCVNAPVDTDGCKTFVGNPGYQSRLECQTSAQCDQGTCCGHRTFFNNGQGFFYDLVSCVDTCTSADVTLCDPTNAADVCPMIPTQNGPVQGICKTSASLPPGYFVCGTP